MDSNTVIVNYNCSCGITRVKIHRIEVDTIIKCLCLSFSLLHAAISVSFALLNIKHVIYWKRICIENVS